MILIQYRLKWRKTKIYRLNPTKISGLCGRLMCCLKYENDDYEIAKEGMPDIGDITMTPDGPGKVIGLNVLERLIQVYLAGAGAYCGIYA